MSDRDVIALRGLSAYGHHGVLPEERRVGQTFVVDVVLHVDTEAAAAADELGLTADYSTIAATVVSLVEGEPVQLIETLAGRIATACLTHERVASVEVTVHKPQAPMGISFDDVSVTVVRSL
jgi:dihydroneopterin aldolase